MAYSTVPVVLSTPTVLVNDVYTPNATALVSYTSLYTEPLATVSLQLWATSFDTSQPLPATIAFNLYTFVSLLSTNLAINNAIQTFVWYSDNGMVTECCYFNIVLFFMNHPFQRVESKRHLIRDMIVFALL